MPLYEYTCRKCERDFEALVSVRGDDEVACPQCGGEELSRHFGLPAAGRVVESATNCRGDGPPCGTTGCGRKY